MARVLFTPLAERQIDALHRYIADHSDEDRADSYVSRIIEFCNRLARFPIRGRRRDDLIPGLRIIGFERRVSVAFIATADDVLIEGVFYGGRKIEKYF
jgi:toxin ParE1/3/4